MFSLIRSRAETHVLHTIHTSFGTPAPCQLLNEIKAVHRRDVEDWFSSHQIYDESRRRDEINEIFQANGKPILYKNMIDIEKHLKETVEEYQKQRSQVA